MRWMLLASVLGMAVVAGQAGAANNDPFGKPKLNDYWEDEKIWQESEVPPPAFPVNADLLPVYVSAVATNEYLIDAKSVSVGPDGVVRYSLVVRTPGGAQNISFEGMRCDTREWKMLATGRITPEGGVWAKARISEWRPIENKPVNRHHAAIWKDYFCPNGSVIRSGDDGRNALKMGSHPDLPANQK